MSTFIDNEYEGDVPARYSQVVEEIIEAALDYLDCPYECELNVLFTGNDAIKEINKCHRDIDSPTDVLSFPLIDFDIPGDFSWITDDMFMYFNQDSGELMLGDIVLNVDRVHSQAKEYGHSIIRELAFLTSHSMLHLAGYDHIDEEMRIDMEKRQEEILNMKGYTRDYEEE